MEHVVEQLDDLFDAVNDSGLMQKIAKSYATMRDTLIEEGFSREEAVSILTHQGAFKTSG